MDSAPAFPKVGSGLSSWGPGNNKLPKETQILSWLSSLQNLSQNSCCAKESGIIIIIIIIITIIRELRHNNFMGQGESVLCNFAERTPMPKEIENPDKEELRR